MKNIIFMVLIAFTAKTFAQGSFSTPLSDITKIYNSKELRQAQAENNPWAGSFFPYAQNGTAVKLDENQRRAGQYDNKAKSPLEKFDAMAGYNPKSGAEAWEKRVHTCEHLEGDQKEGCEGWWGHCNGWTAAAIREPQPKQTIKIGNEHEFTVADQKAILTEYWLSTNSLFAGATDKTKKVGDWICGNDSANASARRAYWDLDPKTFLLILTNHIGSKKLALALDKHSADEVWNQPIVGYKILKMKPSDLSGDGKELKLNVKMVWANDVPFVNTPGEVSGKVDIKALSDDPEDGDADIIGDHFESRTYAFTLIFSQPLRYNSQSDQLVWSASPGQIANSAWELKTNCEDAKDYERNFNHPDFFWYPLNPVIDNNGYANPYVLQKYVDIIRKVNNQLAAGAQTSNRKVQVTFQKAPNHPLVLLSQSSPPGEYASVLANQLARDDIRAAVLTEESKPIEGVLVLDILNFSSNALETIKKNLGYLGLKIIRVTAL